MSLASAAVSPLPAPLSGTPLLQAESLTVRFEAPDGPFDVVRDVSFAVRPGRTFCLVGESGCGKSMTARALLGLVPEPGRLAGGRILFQGDDLATLPEKSMERVRGRDIGMIFQEPMTSLNPVIRVGDQVAEGLIQHTGMSKAQAQKQVLDMFRKLGIPDPESRISDYPHQFSGGMKQRVVIAIAMICNPDIIIADEPTTALDVTIQAQIMELMKSLQVNDHKSIILITHNMGLVAEMADEVCVMYMGRVMEFGSLEDIFENPSHPYTQALLRSVPVLGLAEGQELGTIPGITPNPAELGPGCEFAGRCPFCQERCKEKDIPRFEVSPGHYVRCLKFDSFQEVD